MLHPDMRPWAELDEDTRDKDRAAVHLIPALLAMAGYRIRRVAEPQPEPEGQAVLPASS